MTTVDIRAGVRRWVRTHPLLTFFTLAYTISWLAWLFVILNEGGGGWYSYNLLDNLGRLNVRCILPQFHDPQVGDVVPMSPDGKQGPLAKNFERERWMLWWDGKGGMSWAWGFTRWTRRARV